MSTQLNDFKYNKWINSFIWLIDWTQTGTYNLGQSGCGSNGNEGVVHIPQIFRVMASQADGLVSYPEHSLGLDSYSSSEV